MNYDDKNKLAIKIELATTLSVKEVKEIIDGIFVNQGTLKIIGCNIDTIIDKKHVNEAEQVRIDECKYCGKEVESGKWCCCLGLVKEVSNECAKLGINGDDLKNNLSWLSKQMKE